MNAQDLINMVDDAQFDTKEEWQAFREKAFGIFDTLSEDDRRSVLEENIFEPLSMILEAYEYAEKPLP